MSKAYYRGIPFGIICYRGKKYKIKIDKSKGIPLVTLVPVNEDKKD